MDDKLNNVVNLFKKRQQEKVQESADPRIVELLQMGKDFDRVIIEYVLKGVSLQEVSTIMSHRLAEVISHTKEHKDMLLALIISLMAEKVKGK